ncbi:sensor domain-containing diguanylate cyclase/phosphohydrolase [Paraclostridium bifermentans]|uniref:sensor domain-containing diguanylate cyclase/phosphohydrolase n=1 Tax=Paraclostridium bifermentans TaxID=1490 RepID=UPI00359C760A
MINKLLEILLDNVPYSMWLRSIDGRFLFVNKYYADSLNLDKADVIGKTLQELYPKDLAIEYESNYEEVLQENKAKLFSGYQDDIFLECYLAPIKVDENIEFFIGILQDQTERKKYEEEITKQKELLQTIIDTIPDCIFHKDINGKYLDCNVAFSNEYYKQDRKKIIGKSDRELKSMLKADDLLNKNSIVDEIVKLDNKVIKNKKKECSKLKIKYNEKTKYMESIKVPIINKKGDVSSIVGISRNVTDNVALEKKLKKMSYKDKLTGLYNRAYFDEKLKELANNKDLPLSLIMGDVNGLKIVNDTIGHLKGDELLVSISKVIKNSCRKEDFVFRWGGDEICIILPKTTKEEAQNICNRIKNNCKEYSTGNIPLSISLGTSTKVDSTKDINEVLMEAEDKAYREKLIHGRDTRRFIMNSLQETLISKHPQTQEHADRVVKYANRLGKKLGLSNEELSELILLAKLHDIGKIGIPDNVLLKPGKLNDYEFNIMKTHSEKGYRIALSNPEIEQVAQGILTHHERYDGSGYPLGLKQNQIPYLARIICVVDAYDAMTNDRSYKNKISKKDAIKELIKYSGSQFDPEIVNAFLEEIVND